jgi:hypothetical protein
MKILVLAHEKDDHAAPVSWALKEAGYQAACWSGVSFTPQEQASLLLDEQPSIVLGPHCLEFGDAVWLRQPEQPAHDLDVPDAGRHAAVEEYISFFNSIAHVLETADLGIRCVNRYSASCLIRNKAVQLQLARACGLRIPETLMSNSPAAVRSFFESRNSAICKPFSAHIWQQHGSQNLAVTGTFALSSEDLPADAVLTYAPAIYQQRVAKQFDVRTVLMGQNMYSYAVHTARNSLDWRHDALRGSIDVQPIATPSDVEKGILDLATRTGVCFGSLDFAVDAKGGWWFLEINEQGQFLWLDEFVPDGSLQQRFCVFITARGESTEPLESRQRLFPSFAEYRKSHAQEDKPNLTTVPPGSPCRSVEL